MSWLSLFGPVFEFERITTSRRWQHYALRSLVLLTILIGMGIAWDSFARTARMTGMPLSHQTLAMLGRNVFQVLVVIEITFVLLAAPAATAGAICLEKQRGTLAHILVTQLSNREIILGKLAVRLTSVLMLIAASFPMVAISLLLGGVDPVQLLGAFMVIVGTAVLGCSLALTLSIWMNRTLDVLLTTLSIWIVWLCAYPFSDILRIHIRPLDDIARGFNPYMAALGGGRSGWTGSIIEQMTYLFVTLCLSGALTLLATMKVRDVALAQSNRGPRKSKTRKPKADTPARRRLLTRAPSLDPNPVLWLEWRRTYPSRIVRFIWRGYFVLGTIFSLLIMTLAFGSLAGESSSVFSGFLITVGFLLMAVTAGSSLSEERVRDSLDVLLTTPMSTNSILAGKWWATYQRIFGLSICPTLIALCSMHITDLPGAFLVVVLIFVLILVQGAAIVSLGLALATWIKRPGVAVMISISLLMASIVCWPLFQSLRSTVRNEGQFSLGSPFFNIGYSTFVLQAINRNRAGMSLDQHTVWMLGWAIFYGAVALGLYLATRLTFDRCLGRISDDATRPQRTLKQPAALKPVS